MLGNGDDATISKAGDESQAVERSDMAVLTEGSQVLVVDRVAGVGGVYKIFI